VDNAAAAKAVSNMIVKCTQALAVSKILCKGTQHEIFRIFCSDCTILSFKLMHFFYQAIQIIFHSAFTWKVFL
jgi:hypothetical protein